MKYCVSGKTMDFVEVEDEYENLVDAKSAGGVIIEEGGYAEVTDELGNFYDPFSDDDETTKEFNSEAIARVYETGDIVSYDHLYHSLGEGYGDPGNVHIATLDGCNWYPAGFCSRAGIGVWDCDETRIFLESEYGKTWIAVCSEGIDGWAVADAGVAYLLDL